MTTHVRTCETPAAVHEAAASVFAQAAADALRERGMFTVALAGGSTPRGVYALLAEAPHLRDAVAWDNVEFFWTDERPVPPDHHDSNYRMAYEAMLSKLPVRPERVHRIKAEDPDAAAAASSYELDVRTAFGTQVGNPRFDLILLGLGADAHVASLFPGSHGLSESRRLVVANWIQKLDAFRITMTLPLINAARQVMFVVVGKDKAEAVREVFQPGSWSDVPARWVRPLDGEALWVLDQEASSLLNMPDATSRSEDRQGSERP